MGNAAKVRNIDFSQSSSPKQLLTAIDRAQAILEFSTDGIVVAANDNFCRVFGLDHADVIGKAHSSFCEASYVSSQEYEVLWSRLRAGEYVAGEFKRLGKSGKEVWLLASYCPVLSDEGKVVGVVEVATDISESRKELQARTEIMNLTSIVSESDLKGNILSVNDKFIEVSQYGLNELIGKPHNTTRHPDMPKETFKEMWSTIGRGNMFRGIIKNRKKDGSPYYVDAVITPILGDNGKPKKYLGVRYEITEAELERQNMRAIFNAIDSVYAYIEFDTAGNVLKANKNFLGLMGYSSEEVVGRHHRLFVDPAFAKTPAYDSLWRELNAGNSQSEIFKRVTKTGREVWIQGIYSPVKDEMGVVKKVVKIATDVTDQNMANLENSAKLRAIDKTQAVVEFELDGTLITANENFQKTIGYELSELVGKSHRMFCTPEFGNSADYKDFWASLNRGDVATGEFKRVGKGGREVWIRASYNPILDLSGRPFKVVKYAYEITNLKLMMASVEETAAALSAASAELTATATQMSGTASRTSHESNSAGLAAEQVASGVQIVATNMEEMVASIKEIARSTNESSQMAKSTMSQATMTNATIAKLGASSQEIGDVIKVISSIAQQTNLLALNATIEAARAGEAGRGFTVVANEVKELAKQTARATNEITNKIGAIQKDTLLAVEAIGGISSAVERLNGISSVIAAAVEEQTATTNEVSRVVVESKKGVESIASTIKIVTSASNESSLASSQTLQASKELSQLAERLTALIQAR